MFFKRDQMALRAADELTDGAHANLGIGPLPIEDEVDAGLVNAGKRVVTARKGASYYIHDSFATILGGMHISGKGDPANWMVRGRLASGMGGTKDMIAGVKRGTVLMGRVATDSGQKQDSARMLRPAGWPGFGERHPHRIARARRDRNWRSWSRASARRGCTERPTLGGFRSEPQRLT